jgi:hypothetical protein
MPATKFVNDSCRYTIPQDELPPSIREANARVVGYGNPKHGPNDNRHLPGIDLDSPRPFTILTFGATREYGPDEGWQHVSYKKKARKVRRYRAQQPKLEVIEEEY